MTKYGTVAHNETNKKCGICEKIVGF